MYEAEEDPNCYPGTSILRNRGNLRTQAELDKFEAFITTQRAQEPLPVGRLDYRHYRAIHRHFYQDVYQWAGRFRHIRIAKGGNWFCYPEHIDRKMRELFDELASDNYLRDLEIEVFATKTAHFLAELNAIHPFRDGNGRTQNVFLNVLADRAGHPLDLERLDPSAMLEAMIASFGGNEQPLVAVILKLMRTA